MIYQTEQLNDQAIWFIAYRWSYFHIYSQLLQGIVSNQWMIVRNENLWIVKPKTFSGVVHLYFRCTNFYSDQYVSLANSHIAITMRNTNNSARFKSACFKSACFKSACFKSACFNKRSWNSAIPMPIQLQVFSFCFQLQVFSFCYI